MTEFIF